MVAEIKIGITTCFFLGITLVFLAACGQQQAEPPAAPQQAPSISQAAPAPAQEPAQAPAAASDTAPESQEPIQAPVTAMNTPSETQESIQEPTTAPAEKPSVDVDQIDAFDDSFFLEILSPEEDPAFVEEPAFVVLGRTRVDAAVSVNDQLVDVDADGILEAVVDLEEGPNVIEVVASTGAGAEESAVLTVFYLPQEG